MATVAPPKAYGANSPRYSTYLRKRTTFWPWDHPALSLAAIGRATERMPMAGNNRGNSATFLLGHPPTATVGATFIKSMQIGEERR
jgi:hypothetical protein